MSDSRTRRKASDALDDWRSAERAAAVAEVRREAAQHAAASAALAERAAVATSEAAQAALVAASAAKDAATATADAARATAAAARLEVSAAEEAEHYAVTDQAAAKRAYQAAVDEPDSVREP